MANRFQFYTLHIRMNLTNYALAYFKDIQHCFLVVTSSLNNCFCILIFFQIYNPTPAIRAWPIHRQHSQSGPIVGQSEQLAIDDNRWPVHADASQWGYSPNSPSHGLHRPPCSTIQGSAPYLSLMRRAVVLLPRWTNNHYPVPGLIKLYKLACLPNPSIDKAFQ